MVMVVVVSGLRLLFGGSTDDNDNSESKRKSRYDKTKYNIMFSPKTKDTGIQAIMVESLINR